MEASLYRLAHQNSTMPSCAIVAPEDISYFSYYAAIPLTALIVIIQRPSKRKGRGNVLLLIHHVVTNCLLAGAIYVGYHGVALLVLLIHNLSDLFLDTAQIIREKKMSDALLYPSFAVLLFFWVSTRLYTFPQILFYSYAYGAQQIHVSSILI
ncbi:unnamed protein product, partial [Mesorhabditis spiculigera]